MANSISSWVSSDALEGFEKRKLLKPDWCESDAILLGSLCMEHDKAVKSSAGVHELSLFGSPVEYNCMCVDEDSNNGFIDSKYTDRRLDKIYVLKRQMYLRSGYKFTREEEKKTRNVMGKAKTWMKYKNLYRSRLDNYFKHFACFAVQVDASHNPPGTPRTRFLHQK